jgi:hypothetical protein
MKALLAMKSALGLKPGLTLDLKTVDAQRRRGRAALNREK